MGSTADRRKREREKREAADRELEKRARIEKEIEARKDREAEDKQERRSEMKVKCDELEQDRKRTRWVAFGHRSDKKKVEGKHWKIPGSSPPEDGEFYTHKVIL